MNTCPKCSASYHKIIGPRFVKDALGRESLRYTCMQCGYSMSEPCRDSKSNEARNLSAVTTNK